MVAATLRLVVVGTAAALLFIFCSGPTWTVVGDSMAPNLLGLHYPCRCEDCGYRFTVSPSVVDHPATCPMCGRRGLAPARSRPLGGTRLGLGAKAAPPLRRFEVAAFRTPDGEPMVKRVLGLPGERVRIHRGELWVNGRRYAKSMAEFRQTAVAVHDARYRAPETLPARWQTTPSANWQRRGSVFATERGQLRYRHQVSYRCAIPRGEASEVRAHRGYNVDVSGEPGPVNDLLLTADYRFTRPGRVIWVLRGAHGQSADTLMPDDSAILTAQIGDRAIEWSIAGLPTPARTPRIEGWQRVEFGRFDGRALLSVDGRTLLVAEANDLAGAAPRACSPAMEAGEAVRIEAATSLVVGAPRIDRDVHYESPSYLLNARQDQWMLGANEWFFLGDNPAVSKDSRRLGPVPFDRLLGRVRW
ncbi:MAG: hypothetical protein KDB14_22030 [Planctomycetales bacterium]|nr:hypothetical protein [Planctomycetales bacterium]